MKLGVIARRFLVPRFCVTAWCWWKFGAFVSPHAEVEMSPLLALGSKTQIASYTKLKASLGPLRIGERVDIAIGWSVHGARLFTPLDAFPEVGAYYGRLTARPAFRSSLPASGAPDRVYTEPRYYGRDLTG